MKLKKTIQGIGIDVSKETLDVTLISDDTLHFVVKNTLSGIKKCIKKIEGYDKKIVMESTGRYHLLVAFKLSLAGFDIRVINPLMARKHLSGSIRNNKTDKADSKILAEMAIVERALPARFSQKKVDIKIRQKMGLIASLEKQIQNFNAVMRDYYYFQQKLSLQSSNPENNIQETLKDLAKHKAALEKEIQDLILKQKENDNNQKILQSIPGVSALVSSFIDQFLDTDVPSSKNWIAFVGIDVAARQSGTWKGRGRLSKRGNSYLRKRFYGAAWGAVMNHPQFRKYYDDLKERGLKHVEALLVITRKILNIAFVLLKKNQLFDEKICFAS